MGRVHTVSLDQIPKIKAQIKRPKKQREDLTFRFISSNKNPKSYIYDRLEVLKNKLRNNPRTKNKQRTVEFSVQWPTLVEISEKWMGIKNNQKNPEFIWNR